ncbi:DUF5133 domain-containing protein [Streptomyces sp. NPDC058287]|uniref:DUF5133 domain-containing protein n=1 Tax=unclassified Streptomyces TaxID=2593676 RepID=UPI0036EC3EAE
MRQLEEAAYTLCVTTGTRQLDTALYVARRQLADFMVVEEPRHPWPASTPQYLTLQVRRSI